MIRIQKIKAKNFKSVGNAGVEVNFNANPEMILLDGKVGSGKSMLLSIISFNWFGKDYGTETKIAKLINRRIGKKLETETTFTIDGDNSTYKIFRGYKPKKFIIYKDDKEIFDESTATVKQVRLENELLGCSYNIFTQFFINDKFKSFMSLTKAERRKYMEDIISYLVIFSDMNKKINNKKSNVNTEISILERDIDKCDAKIEAYNESSDNDNSNLSSMLKEIEEKIDSINKKIEKIDSDKLEKSINKLEEKINKGKEKKRKAERKYIEAKTRISDYEESKSDENDKIICPNCKTEISITDYFNKIDIDEYKEIMSKSSKLIEKINDKTSEWSEKLISYKEQYDTLDEHKKTIRRKNKEKKDIEDKINSGKKDIEKKIKSIEKKMKELKKNKLVFDRELRYLDLIQRIVSDEGLRKYIIKTIIPYINRKIQYYIQEFELPYNVKFDDTFDIFITDGRNEVEWGELSSGQQTSVNLSILFAFYYFIRVKSMFNLNLQFFDEIMDRSLDGEKTKLVFDILKKDDLFFDKNIVIITHKDSIKNYEFDRIIKAELVNFTRYYEVGENNV